MKRRKTFNVRKRKIIRYAYQLADLNERAGGDLTGTALTPVIVTGPSYWRVVDREAARAGYAARRRWVRFNELPWY